MNVLVYAVLCVLPAAAFKLVLLAISAWNRRPHRPSPAVPAGKYGETLRRLSADHDRVLIADVPAKAARLRALELAYDDTLRAACQKLHVDVPPDPWDATTRVQLEADLVTHGLTW